MDLIQTFFRDKAVLITGASSGIGEELVWLSKFALRSLANSIDPELRPLDIKVTLISPGFVPSNIGRVDNDGNLRTKSVSPPPAWLVLPTDKAARQILLRSGAR